MIGARVRGNTLAHAIAPEAIKCHSQVGPRTKTRAGPVTPYKTHNFQIVGVFL